MNTTPPTTPTPPPGLDRRDALTALGLLGVTSLVAGAQQPAITGPGGAQPKGRWHN